MNTIDISALPPPQVVEMPEFQALLQQRIAELQFIDPTFDALVESDPAIKQLEILVYREMVNVARFNSGARAVLLAYAKGTNLDQLGNNFDVPRQVVTPADDTTIPPTEAEMEDDDRYRLRIRLSWYARNTAGSIQAYEYFTLSADPGITDAGVYGPAESEDIPPGHVHVYPLSSDGEGTPSDALLQTVSDALNEEYVRPLTDYVSVLAPTVITYEVNATLIIADGPDANTVEDAAEKGMQRYADSVHKIGTAVSLAGVYRALKQPGVDDVQLDSPLATIPVGIGEVSFCTGINLTVVRGSDVPDTPAS
ncbi:baseplate J/gp47 family protein [Scandinavium goeteborgense]|uniref:baseplate assembly protein n=1 Tax=Scandinavium goeteborgense TaxID=1851514 RepID=UPI0021667955|nr:baseplate J/gp47 family protein [Scandinavium goeteborgense]MCS2154706.1 baseplate J/gp47 family protein [Scandinavium goeteborgense]